MLTIYEPAGKAKEYSELALNLYRGCDHGCTYCYAPSILHMPRKDFIIPTPRLGIIDALRKDAPKFSGRQVLLCFTCDPYQKLDVEYKLTRQAIEVLHENNISVRILTKGGLRAERDFDLLGPEDAFGVTLTSYGDMVDKFEPDAAPVHERIESLEEAYDKGIPTWVSLEPVVAPLQAINLIIATHLFVDEYKIGKWNYDSRAKEIDWGAFVNEAVSLLEWYGNKYYIKEDLKEYLK